MRKIGLDGRRAFLVVCSAIFFVYAVNTIFLDTDFWFLLSNGDYLRQHWLPEYDWQSVYGYKVVVYNAGVSLLFSWIDEWFGHQGVIVLISCIWTITLAVICSFAKKRYFASYLIATLLVATAIFLCTVTRPHSFSVMFAVILIRVLYGDNEKAKIGTIATILPLQLFFHATFWLVPVAIVCWYFICYKPTKPLVISFVVGIALSCAYAFLLTPYGLKVLLHPLYCLGISAYGNIDELQKPSMVFVIVGLIVSIGVIIAYYFTRIRRQKFQKQMLFVPVMTLVASIGFCFAARLLLFAYCLIAILGCIAFEGITEVTVSFFNKCMGTVILMLTLTYAGINAQLFNYEYNEFYNKTNKVGEYLVEQGATSALSDDCIAGPYLFYNYGIHCYFDTRLETYIPSFNENEDLFTPYIDWTNNGNDEFVKKQSPEWVVLYGDAPVPDNYTLQTTLETPTSKEFQACLDALGKDVTLDDTSTIKIFKRQD